LGRRKGLSLNRRQVVDAAIGCIEAQGPGALGVTRVAAALGIKPPSIYNHVGKGDALAWAVAIEGNRRIRDAMRLAVRGVVAPRRQLEALTTASRAWARANPGLYTVMAQTRPDNAHPEFAPIMDDILELFGRPLAQLGVAPVDTVHAVRGLRAAMHGFLLLEASGQFQLADDVDASFAWLIRAILDGVETDVG
jgi:AcrR family transcriptional regulator